MIYLIYFVIFLGLFETASNLFHLLKWNKELVAMSAKRQHQELFSDLNYMHFYVKAVIMFLFGILFTASALIAFATMNLLFFKMVLALFGIYGLAQAIYYKRPYKVWMSAFVYILPFLLLIILSGNAHGATFFTAF
jgi:hypothetical protein